MVAVVELDFPIIVKTKMIIMIVIMIVVAIVEMRIKNGAGILIYGLGSEYSHPLRVFMAL